MTVTWQRLAGDTSSFAISISLLRDPDEGVGADPDESASWGAFQLWVNGTNLCLHNEQGEDVDAVHWYLLPLLEWIVVNWDPLLHEERLPVRATGGNAAHSLRTTGPLAIRQENDQASAEWDEWWQRHCLQASRSGGPFPEIFFRRTRDSIEISWLSDAVPGVPSDYMRFAASEGMARLEPEQVAVPIFQAVTEVIGELSTRRVASTRIAQLREALRVIPDPGRRAQRLAWIAGLGRRAEAVADSWKTLVKSASRFPAEIANGLVGNGTTDSSPVVGSAPAAALLFGAASPSVSESDIDKLIDVLASAITDPREETSELASLVEDAPMARWGRGIHEQGYELADDALAALDIDNDDWVDVEAVVMRLGIEIQENAFTDRAIRAISIAGMGFSPCIVLNSAYHWNRQQEVRRFSLAHELCHILADRDRARRVVVGTGAWAPRDIERRANAFAANFLMPPRLIEHHLANLESPISQIEGVNELADRLRVSDSAALDHLFNLGFIGREDWEDMRRVVHWSRLEDKRDSRE